MWSSSVACGQGVCASAAAQENLTAYHEKLELGHNWLPISATSPVENGWLQADVAVALTNNLALSSWLKPRYVPAILMHDVLYMFNPAGYEVPEGLLQRRMVICVTRPCALDILRHSAHASFTGACLVTRTIAVRSRLAVMERTADWGDCCFGVASLSLGRFKFVCHPRPRIAYLHNRRLTKELSSSTGCQRKGIKNRCWCWNCLLTASGSAGAE